MMATEFPHGFVPAFGKRRYVRRATIIATAILLAVYCMPVSPAARVRVRGLYQSFGVVPRGRTIVGFVSITNYSVYPVSVFVGKGCSCQVVRVPDAVVLPAESVGLRVECDTAACTPGDYRRAVPIAFEAARRSWKEVSQVTFSVD